MPFGMMQVKALVSGVEDVVVRTSHDVETRLAQTGSVLFAGNHPPTGARGVVRPVGECALAIAEHEIDLAQHRRAMTEGIRRIGPIDEDVADGAEGPLGHANAPFRS